MRLAELVGTLALAVDAGTGLPDYHALRGATLAVGLARAAKCSEEMAQSAFYLPLLAMSGCTAGSDSSARMMGDEVAIGHEIYGLDWGNPKAMFPPMMRTLLRSHGPLSGLAALARSMSSFSEAPEVSHGHCEVATQMAEEFGFDAAFRRAVFQMFERWDGTGKPQKLKGEAIELVARIALVAVDANIGHKLGGVDGASTLLRERSGIGLDPNLVDLFVSKAAELCAPLDDPSPWTAAFDAEPQPWRTASEEEVDTALTAIAHFTDLKCRFTRGHSTGVSELCARAAERLGLDGETQKRLARAGLVHDVGRVATTAAIWDKSTPLTDTEREKIRLHSYVGERILSRAPSLAAIAEIASVAHERLDGSGYHRRLPAAACTAATRVLGAADVYQALREARPHRSALSADQAASELNGMSARGQLCPDAVTAVLSVAGHSVRPPARHKGLHDGAAHAVSIGASKHRSIEASCLGARN